MQGSQCRQLVSKLNRVMTDISSLVYSYFRLEFWDQVSPIGGDYRHHDIRKVELPGVDDDSRIG